MENKTEQSEISTIETAPDQKESSINKEKLNQYIEQLKLAQNLPLGLLSGILASLVGAILWALITVSIEYQIGYMAIAVGLMVGYAIKLTGHGIDKIFGILGALLSLFGCLLGNFLSIVGFVAKSEGISFFETLKYIDYSLVPDIMISAFSPMDILFYGLAIYEGYRFSFRQITEQDILKLQNP